MRARRGGHGLTWGSGIVRGVVRAGLMAAVMATAVTTDARAQRFTLELKAGAAVGNYTATAAGLDFLPAPAFGAILEARLAGPIAGYVGFTRSSFGCEEGFCAGREVALASQGLILGGRWNGGLPWLRAGLAVQQLRLTADGQDQNSDTGFGWDVAAGVELPIGRRIRLRPGLTYLRHGAAMEASEDHVAVLALELGVAVGLGG